MVNLKKFGAPWCGPCTIQDEILDELEVERPSLDIEHINVEEDTLIANDYQVQSLPTLIVENDNGDIVERFIGVTQLDDLAEAIDSA